MRKGYLISIPGALLALAACVCVVTAANILIVPGVYLPTTSDKGYVNLYLDSAPAGLSGYSVTFTLSGTSIADIDTSSPVKYPSGTGWDSRFASSKSTGAGSMTIRVVDVGSQIQPSTTVTNIYLGSVPIRGVAKGTTDITVTVDQMDDDSGSAITPAPKQGTIAVALPPGSLRVTSTPVKGALIFVDGVQQKSGTTPIKTDATISGVVAGPHKVKVTLANYVGQEKPVTVPSGGTGTVSFALTRTGSINVKTTPSGASITLDTMLQQGKVTPYTLTGLDPTPFHAVKVEKAGYYEKEWLNQKVQAAQTLYLSCTLDPVNVNDYKPYGGIQVQTLAGSKPIYGASVLINGKENGLLTEGSTRIYQGTYSVSVKLNGYKTLPPDPQSVTVKPHETSKVIFSLKEIPSVPVSIDIKPGSCPNPLNREEQGVIPVAVAGGAGLNVKDIDLAKPVTLNGVPASMWALEYVTRPFTSCTCPPLGQDGTTDLSLKFPADMVAASLDPNAREGDIVTLTLIAFKKDGTPVKGTDCMKIEK